MLDVKASLGALPRSCYEGLPAGCYGNRPVAITVLGSVPVTGSRYGQPFPANPGSIRAPLVFQKPQSLTKAAKNPKPLNPKP